MAEEGERRVTRSNAAQSQKSKIKMYLPLALAALIIFAVSVSLWYVSKEYAYHRQTVRDNIKSVGGEWDLRDIDFDKRIEFIDGEVEYVPGALLLPDEFSGYQGEVVTGYVPGGMDAATARMRILVPPGRYLLSGNSIDYNERIYINGEWRLDVGLPGLTKEDSVPGSRYIKLEIYAPDGVIEIVRQSSNFVHKENSAYAGFWIGTQNNMAQMIALQEMPANIIVGLYLALFLMHLVLWLLFRGYRPNIWFSLLCLMGFAHAGFIGRKIFWSMFPSLPWGAVYKLSCAAVALTGTLVMLLFNEELPGLAQKWAVRVFSAVQIVLAIFFLCVDTVLLSRTSFVAALLFTLIALYLAARFLWLLRKREWRRGLRPEHILTLFGAVAALAAFLHDVIYHNGVHLFSYEITDLGTLTFVLCQMAAMFYATMRRYSDTRQLAEAARREAKELDEKNRLLDNVSSMKTEFFQNMSHDLKTPLTVISTDILNAADYLDFAMDREDMRSSLAHAQSEIMRMARMVDGALKYSAMQDNQGHTESLEIASFLRDGAEHYRAMLERTGNRLFFDAPETLPPVACGADTLFHVLSNLLSNANRYTSNGEIHIRAAEENRAVSVTIQDTGSGIEPALLPRVFQRGVSDGGTGLGLSICKSAIESLGGKISITSETGRGTSVTFTLPLYREEPENE